MMFDDDDVENKGREKHQKGRELELLTMRNLMSSENGRAFMYRCLQNCYTFENIFSQDTLKNAHDSGLRSHGLWLDSELREASQDYYYKMLKENR